MRPGRAAHWFTARFVLFGDGGAAAAIADIVAEQRLTAAVAGRLALSTGAHRALVADLGRAVAGLLDVDLAELLIAGWQRHRTLRRAAHVATAAPGALVHLPGHRIVSVHEPAVDLQVDGRRVTTVRFELRVTSEVRDLAVVVRDARMVDVRGGTVEVTATLSAVGIEVASRTLMVDARPVIGLGAGVPVLDDPADAGPPAGPAPWGAEPLGAATRGTEPLGAATRGAEPLGAVDRGALAA